MTTTKTTPRHEVAFHFDFLSPYAYLAWHSLKKMEEARGDVVITCVPTVLAPLLNAAGQKGPAEIPAKRPYVFKDAVRGAHKVGLPLAIPPSHPFHPLLALRVVCAANVDGAAAASAATTALFAVAWGGVRYPNDAAGGLDVPAVVIAALDAAGLDGASLVDRAQTPEVKAQLKQNTLAAVEGGLFGVPSMVFDSELFWGFDALGYLADALDGNDPARGLDLSPWEQLPATASRK